MLTESRHGRTYRYSYDANGQLLQTDATGQPTQAQRYDANGNRSGSGLVIGTNNQLLADARFDYQYDAEGNLIQKTERATGAVTSYSYDYRNRLTDVTTRSAGGMVLASEQYRYDVFDRRVAVTVNGKTLYTVYDGANAWADYTADGSVQTRYLFGDRADEILARFKPGQGTAWYLTDHLGSVRDVVVSQNLVSTPLGW